MPRTGSMAEVFRPRKESAHVPPCSHGAEAHSSMSTPHPAPEKPSAHVHLPVHGGHNAIIMA